MKIFLEKTQKNGNPSTEDILLMVIHATCTMFSMNNVTVLYIKRCKSGTEMKSTGSTL